jgi:hypothetical protein
MSVHRVRLIYSEGGSQSFNGWLSTWLTNMQPWSARENALPTLVEPVGSSAPAHYRGDLTFAWSEDRAIIEDQLNGYLGPYCDWGIVGYHVCDHDQDDRDGCSWGSVTEHGAVPEEVSL